MAIVERVKKDGTTTFQVKVKDRAGKWFPTPAFSDRISAEKHEDELIKKKQKGVGAVSGDARATTELDFWEVWKDENRLEVSEGWKLSQNQMHRDYIEPVLGNILMADIGPMQINQVMKRMMEMGRGAQMRIHVYNLLKQMFDDAIVYYEMLQVNPVKKEFHRAKLKEIQASFLYPDQVWRLLAVAKDDWAGPIVWIESLAGLRCEAAIPLQLGAIHWGSNQILICRAWKKKVQKLEEFPKNGSSEYVPMMPALKEYLWEIWETKNQNPDALVCVGPRGGMVNYDSYLKALTRLCKEAGVPRVTPHELRHSCTELFTSVGASSEDIRRLLNQKSLTATRRYIHRTDERLNRLAGLVTPLRVIDGGNSDPSLGNSESFPNGKQSACGQN